MRSSKATQSDSTRWRARLRSGRQREPRRSQELRRRVFYRQRNGGEEPKPVFSCMHEVSNTAVMAFRMFWGRSTWSWHQGELAGKAVDTQRSQDKVMVKGDVNMARSAISCPGCVTSATRSTVHT